MPEPSASRRPGTDPGPAVPAPVRARFRDYAEVTAVLAFVTLLAWFVPIDYRAFGNIYLLVVVLLCLRVGPLPVLYATVVSVVAWNYVIVPPRMSFAALDIKDALFLGTYFIVALIVGQLTARLRAQERGERRRERRATALFHLTRALSAARTRDEAIEAALRQADVLFEAQTALLLPDQEGRLVAHAAGSCRLGRDECAAVERAWSGEAKTDGDSALRCLPLRRGGASLGVLAIRPRPGAAPTLVAQGDLAETFAAQIALLLEREQFRSAAERENLLMESERLHRTLLDSVSHEMRTPIAVLRAASENLTRQADGRHAALAEEIHTATQRLDRLVANLLSQSRLESGRLRAQMDWCDARDLIAMARKAAGETIAGRSFRVDVAADLPAFLADAALMEQVLVNLFVNVAVHTPAGSPILVEARLDEPAERVCLSVADRGPGLSAELRRGLFQKFQRGAGATAGGLGLGLSIVRGFMQAQHGEVVVDENPAGGARFTLYLPFMAHENVPHE